MINLHMKSNISYKQIERFKEDLDRCTKCGFCMSACPVYREERAEGSVARGKIMLVRSLLEGEIAAGEMEEQLNRCTLCLTCAENCPAGARVPSVVVAARADRVRQAGLSLPYRFIFRWLLPRRRLFG